MNNLVWIVQYLLAAVFLIAGICKIFAISQRTVWLGDGPGCEPEGLSRKTARAIALLEIAGALALVLPLRLGQQNTLPLLAGTGFALLTVAAAVYHARRREPAAPALALFLLSLFVIVGHV
jgi:uncharacterized membrane protein YphA (DoxX/SURF4 family)